MGGMCLGWAPGVAPSEVRRLLGNDRLCRPPATSQGVECGSTSSGRSRSATATRSLPRRVEWALLAVLALHPGQVVRLQPLAEALWAEDSPPTATRSLSSHMSRLRRRLGPDVARRERRRRCSRYVRLPRRQPPRPRVTKLRHLVRLVRPFAESPTGTPQVSGHTPVRASRKTNSERSPVIRGRLATPHLPAGGGMRQTGSASTLASQWARCACPRVRERRR